MPNHRNRALKSIANAEEGDGTLPISLKMQQNKVIYCDCFLRAFTDLEKRNW